MTGTVAAVGLDHAVVEVGGVGLRVSATPGTLAGLTPGSTGRLATSLVVREDSLTLYGFAGDEEREMFELVQTVSGVGPRLALAILAVHSPAALREAVAAQDLTALCKVPGIGKKGAQRMVLELAGRLVAPAQASGASAAAAQDTEQVVAALVGLGWPTRAAQDAVDAVAAAEPGADVAVMLRSALRTLGRA